MKAEIRSPYDQNRYLDAWAATKDRWISRPALADLDLDELVIAGKLARRLGSEKIARHLFREAKRPFTREVGRTDVRQGRRGGSGEGRSSKPVHRRQQVRRRGQYAKAREWMKDWRTRAGANIFAIHDLTVALLSLELFAELRDTCREALERLTYNEGPDAGGVATMLLRARLKLGEDEQFVEETPSSRRRPPPLHGTRT